MSGRSKKKSWQKKRDFKLESNPCYIAKYVDDKLQKAIESKQIFKNMFSCSDMPSKSGSTLRFRKYSEI